MLRIRGANGPILGKFRLAAVSGLLTGLAAGAPVFSARFAPASSVPIRALITGLRLKSQVLTPASAVPAEFTFSAFVARSFTASDSGGTAILPTGLNNMLSSITDSNLSTPSQFTDMRVATTGALTAGTRTLDANPMLVLPAAQIATTATQQSYNESAWEPSSDQRYGLNLQGQTGGVATNAEGIVVTSLAAFNTALVVRFICELEWIEYVTNSAESLG